MHSALSCIIDYCFKYFVVILLRYCTRLEYYYNMQSVHNIRTTHQSVVKTMLKYSNKYRTEYYGLQPKYKLLVDILTVIWHFKSTIDILFHRGGSRLHKKLIILKLLSFYFIFAIIHCRTNWCYGWLPFSLWSAQLKLYDTSCSDDNIINVIISTRT